MQELRWPPSLPPCCRHELFWSRDDVINSCSCRGGEVGIKAWIYLYQQWVIGVRANKNKKAVLSVLTKTFFPLMRNVSRGVLRLSPWLIKPREEAVPMQATDAWARWINKVIRGCSAQRSHSFSPFFGQKRYPSRLPPIADKWYPLHIRDKRG